MRDFLIRIAQSHDSTCFDSTGFINESALARLFGVRASTVRRLLRPEKERQAQKPFTPKKLLPAIRRLSRARTEGAALDFIRSTQAVAPAELKALIRPEGPPKARPATRKKP
jgi:hypothetical protein